MCGIFGFVTKNSSGINKNDIGDIFKKLFLLSESRGREASGFAALYKDEIVVHKSPFSASMLVKLKTYKDFFKKFPEQPVDYFSAIGHSRLVTNGYEQDNKNNQPVYKNGFCGVHNGIIVNQKELWEKYNDEQKETELDSELIPTLLARFTANGRELDEALKMLYENIYGMTSIAFFSEFLDNLLLATNNGSLYYLLSDNENAAIFASEKYILKKLFDKSAVSTKFTVSKITQLQPNTALLIDLNNIHLSIIEFRNGKTFEGTIKKRSKERKTSEIKKEYKNLYKNKSLEHGAFTYPREFDLIFEERRKKIADLKRCTKCILPETFPYIEFDEEGVCNYCRNYNKIDFKGHDALAEFVKKYRNSNNEPECLMPFSGGRDSSFALHYVKNEIGLKPLAYSYDWGMITDLARRNQARMCAKLEVEHILISADIRKKRANIQKNVLAWLKRPNLGTVPLFMAGDKQFFYFANLLMNQNNIRISILGENLLETTKFKSGFCGIKPTFSNKHTYSLTIKNRLKLLAFYGKEYLLNPYYLNSSLLDTLDAFRSYYMIEHQNVNLYDYIKWDEKIITKTLLEEYDWETDPGTKTTWRIGDGTASFYNYIYYMIGGFTENDTFRTNQIREGDLMREEALKQTIEENTPRWDSIKWYCDTIQIDFESAIKIINKTPKLF